jgi:hypothetical protein
VIDIIANIRQLWSDTTIWNGQTQAYSRHPFYRIVENQGLSVLSIYLAYVVVHLFPGNITYAPFILIVEVFSDCCRKIVKFCNLNKRSSLVRRSNVEHVSGTWALLGRQLCLPRLQKINRRGMYLRVSLSLIVVSRNGVPAGGLRLHITPEYPAV